MSNFELLHPAIQHHIVNALGWRDLRPFQNELIPGILEGAHHIILAPTAGGKTEAALFPLLSRMATEDWERLSLVYVCPLRALLNNLYDRAIQYTGFIGRRAGIWHGDVLASQKTAMLRDPPDLLLTTPESLEGILISRTKDHRAFLGGVRAVVVDEIHSFAGDDRGWHLLFVLNRIRRLTAGEFQRIGLSATVGNPDELMGWLTIGCNGACHTYVPGPSEQSSTPDIKLDFVGNLGNATTVISRLHHGEKRLVFIDSRAKAEQLATSLRESGIDTHVTHGSLSREQRMLSERAFAEASNCVIVATSVLELGIDIGTLDRVIQIESPYDVAGFLQRMGRTGRRPGTTRNCLFLTTELAAMVLAGALIELWHDGYVEPAIPPPTPLHIAAQQVMALALQDNGVPESELIGQLNNVLEYSRISSTDLSEIVTWMKNEEMIWSEDGILAMGTKGDDEYGRRNFIDLVSVFCTPPLFTVRCGRQDVGYVDPMTFAQKKEPPWFILLAGRSWQVNHIDWKRRIAYVEATKALGRSRWFGMGPNMSFELAQAYKRILTADFVREWWSNRVRDQITEMRFEYAWLSDGKSTATLGTENRVEWWTFAGTCGNATLAAALQPHLGVDVKNDAFKLSVGLPKTLTDVEAAIHALQGCDWDSVRPSVSDAAIDGLKFSECLPRPLARRVMEDRLRDPVAAAFIASQPVSVLTM